MGPSAAALAPKSAMLTGCAIDVILGLRLQRVVQSECVCPAFVGLELVTVRDLKPIELRCRATCSFDAVDGSSTRRASVMDEVRFVSHK